jgi:uncharacterized surface protein with fasciclin (FAS1) repeats
MAQRLNDKLTWGCDNTFGMVYAKRRSAFSPERSYNAWCLPARASRIEVIRGDFEMRKTVLTLTAACSAFVGTAALAGCYDHQVRYETKNGALQKVSHQTGQTGQKARQSGSDIVDTAVASGSFNTLVTAVKAAGLAETLKGDGPFTVFAPSDKAFAKLPAGTLESLLADKEKLAEVLKYHVVPGRLDSGTVVSMTNLPTAQGSKLPVSSLKIAKTDIETSNGIIHVIDEVLIPQA